jgi:preprotein translocase subunit SecB
MADAQLMLEDLLFPLMEIRTNDKHDAKGDRSGTQLQYGQQLEKMDSGTNRFGLMISVRTDNEKSVNQPYFFSIEAYAVFTVNNASDEASAQKLIAENGTSIVIGAIRERLADLTARAPWGRFLINTILLAETRTITYL